MTVTTFKPGALAARVRGPVLSRIPVRVAVIGVTFVVLIALFGPFVSPHDPAAVIGPPVQGPSSSAPLGTDLLGRDVLSRVLWGGRALLGLSLLATFLAYVIGGGLGLWAAYRRSRIAGLAMRAVELLLVFPPILFLMILVSGAGESLAVVAIGVTILNVPSVARILYSGALDTALRGYVEAAVARGESTRYVIIHEILPSLTGTIAADAGPRFTVSMFLFAGINFLGLGVQPPAADWALMMTENRPAIQVAPLTIAAPAILIAILTLGVNVIADALARAHGGLLSSEELAKR